MSPLLVLTGLIGASLAALPGPARAIDADPPPAAAGEFIAALRAPRGELQPFAGFRARRPEKRYSVTVPIGKPKPAVPLPRVEGPADARLPLVVIDAGHGGHDPGAVSPHGGSREKDITLALARAIRKELLASGRVRVALTRADDRFLVLEERYGIARRLKADLFISVHADAAENQEASGASIYTLAEVASDREAARLAARENRANIINGVDLSAHSGDVSAILLDLTQRETMSLAADFARLLQREAGDEVEFRTAAHRFASFIVLKAPDTPSVLFETGFISNKDDVAFLLSPAGQKKIARGVREAVQVHFARQITAR
jgi:N-acetylmuramoyl-L-alanine amidase